MRRSGRSLVEMLVVMSLMSGVLLLCGQTLVSLFRAESAQTKALREMTGETRLADRFRADVHAASEAKISAGDAEASPELVLSLADGQTVVYSAGKQVTRTVRRAQDRIAFEAWPVGADAQFELKDDVRQAVLMLGSPETSEASASATVKPASAAAQAKEPSSPLRIEAMLGLDNRFRKEAKP